MIIKSDRSLGKDVFNLFQQSKTLNREVQTEAKFILMDDILSKVMWTKLILQEQGCKVTENTVYRDNIKAIKMEINGKTSSEKELYGFD
jgi:hypothetical protein